MSNGASSIQPGKDTGTTGKLLEYNRFIDKQLWRTRSQVRLVDLTSGLLILATGSLAYFFVLALVDHWAVTGGLPGWARVLAFVFYLLIAGWYLFARVVPLLFWRINPLYAAETIERTQPSFKNGLLNFLIFRDHPQELAQSVYQAVEEQAATRLARVPIDNVVDRSKLIRIGYVLVAVFAVCALYKVLSPKDPLTSFGRMVMPWADILPPTRTSIESVEPGNHKAYRGQQVRISAEVRGIERDAEVTLYYTTADGQAVDRPIRMHLPQDGYRHTCMLPPDDEGIQQTMRYWIVAGDARSRDYTLQVVAAPTVVVDSVEYVYPDYTGLAPQSTKHSGDIKAIEGTRVNVHAVANQSIKDGGIDFECDGREELPLAIDGTGDLARGGTVSWVLSLQEDRVSSTYSSYQLRFRNADDEQNLRPIRHTIETCPDLAPEVEFLAPKASEVRVREGDVLPIELTALDPDFALQNVRLLAETGGRKLLNKPLLKKPHRGQFNHKDRLSTRSLGLKAGDVVEYWAVAEDTKSPEPNVATTARRKFQVVPHDAGKNPQDQRGDQQDQPPMAGEPEQPPQDRDERGKQGAQDQSSNEGEQSQEQGQKDDGQQGGQGQQDGQQQSDDSNQSEGSKGSSDQQQSGDQSNDSEQDQSQQGDKSQQGGQDQSGGPSNDSQQGDKQSGQQQGDQQSGNQGGEQNNSQQQPIANDGSQDGDALEKILNHRQEQQQKEQQNGQKQPSEQNQSGQDQTGSQQSPQENKQIGGNKGGQEKPNDKQSNPENTDDDSGESTGNERKGQEQPGQTPNSNAQKKEGEQGGLKGAEQKGNPQDDAKAGDNSQPGEQTDHVGDQAKEEWGQSKGNGQKQKASEQDKQQGQKQPSQQSPKDGQSGKPGSESGNRRDQQPGAQSDQSGSGEHSKGDDQTRQKPNPGKKPDASKGGSDEQEKGDSGAGRSGGDEQGSPESQGDGRQRKKQKQSAGQQDDESKQEAQSPSNSNRESDSNEGESEGDRSGAGKQGGGQKANQPGAGGAGKNTAADEGAGQSDEQGKGLESGKAGSQKEADGQTGQSGDQAGNGSQSRPGEQQSQGEKGNQSGDRPPSEGTPSEQKNNNQGAPGDGSQRGTPQGGGGKGGPAGTPEQQTGHEPGGDKANLEYARKATDLALEHLQDQLAKGEPDQELLDELGWTRQDLEQFLQRWQQMKAAARQNAPQAGQHQRELDDALRSLGLRPRDTTLGGNRATDDTLRNLKESRRSSPPAEYAEQYKAYTQGTARGNK